MSVNVYSGVEVPSGAGGQTRAASRRVGNGLAHLAHVVALDDDGGAVGLAGGDLHERRNDGHDDGDRDAEQLAVVRQRARVVARRRRDRAALALLLRPQALQCMALMRLELLYSA